jgi:hypothetical protein
MYLRVTNVRQGSKTYRYAQIVECYRREDGTPTNRVIASLGHRSESEIAAIRAALQIARAGGTAVLDAQVLDRVQVLQSLRYLDVAMLLRAWRDFGLQALLAELLTSGSTEVSAAEVIAALVLQRCLAPASKLAASRWFPTTALAELQGIKVEQFNNSRVHRALTALEAVEGELQQRLPAQLSQTQGAASLLFVDATDTWFEGHGPPLAAKGKDKVGLFRRRVGIVLLCDERGFPLRWHTIDGRYHDPTALAEMAAEVARLSWAARIPLVVDRALGNAGWVEKLDTLGLRYVTCVPDPELESCGAPIPWAALKQMQSCGEDLEAMRAKAVAAGFVHGSGERYVSELGLFDKSRPKNGARLSAAGFALQILETIESSKRSRTELAASLRLTTRSLASYRKLLSLEPAVRERIRSGKADALSFSQLQQIAALPAERQLEAFDALGAVSSIARRRARRRHLQKQSTLQARAALSLNLQRLIEDRQADEQRLALIRERLEDVNRRLASAQSRRTDASALAEVERIIQRNSFGNVCSATMEKTAQGRRVLLALDALAWQRRRRADGLALIVSHPAVPGSAPERVARYFSKDAVEKDFQSIKNVLGLRPVRHRTDPKLRAHVSICVLALLVARLIEHRVAAAGTRRTLAAIVESLEPIRLNIIDDGRNRYYAVTQPTQATTDVLGELAMLDLVDNAVVMEAITPR